MWYGFILIEVSASALSYFHNVTGIRIIFGLINCFFFFLFLIIGSSNALKFTYTAKHTPTSTEKTLFSKSFSISLFCSSFSLLLLQFCKFRFIFSSLLILHMLLLKTFPIKDVSAADLLEKYWVNVTWSRCDWGFCLLGASRSNCSQGSPSGKGLACISVFQNPYCWRLERVKHSVCSVGGAVVKAPLFAHVFHFMGGGEWAEDGRVGSQHHRQEQTISWQGEEPACLPAQGRV